MSQTSRDVAGRRRSPAASCPSPLSPTSWTFLAFDANDRTQKYFLDDAFDDGVNVSVSAKFNSQLAGRTTGRLTVICSTKDGVSLDDVLLPPGLAEDPFSVADRSVAASEHPFLPAGGYT